MSNYTVHVDAEMCFYVAAMQKITGTESFQEFLSFQVFNTTLKRNLTAVFVDHHISNDLQNNVILYLCIYKLYWLFVSYVARRCVMPDRFCNAFYTFYIHIQCMCVYTYTNSVIFVCGHFHKGETKLELFLLGRKSVYFHLLPVTSL